MEVHFPPELEKKLNDLASQSGRPINELVRDAVAELVNELSETRGMLDRRYDEVQSEKVKLISGDDVSARLREKSAARRARSGS